MTTIIPKIICSNHSYSVRPLVCCRNMSSRNKEPPFGQVTVSKFGPAGSVPCLSDGAKSRADGYSEPSVPVCGTEKAAAHPRCPPISWAAIAVHILLGGRNGKNLFEAPGSAGAGLFAGGRQRRRKGCLVGRSGRG